METVSPLVILEILLLGVIIFYQYKSFTSTRSKIDKLSKIIPQLNEYSLQKFPINHNPVKNKTAHNGNNSDDHDAEYQADEIHDPFPSFSSRETADDLQTVNLIFIKDRGSNIFYKIKNSLNSYLIKNNGSVADFNLMQDVVNRNIDAEDDEITHGLNTPLYLGLMGTMVGIIVGLLNLTLSDTAKGDSFDPTAFLVGVAIAMGASFLGLLFTVLNNNGYQIAKKNLETNKNDFYTFLQTELMPVVNATVSSAVYTLKDVVVNFNKDFSANLQVLNQVFGKSYQALNDQVAILDKLEEMDIKQFAAANVKILKELSHATEKIYSFQLYVDSLNSMMSETNKATMSIRELLSGVNNFSEVAVKLEQRVDESGKLLQFATEHISFLKDNSSQVKSLSNDFTDFTEKSMRTLENVSGDILTNFRKFAEDETEIIQNSIKARPDQFKKLDHLERLESIEKAIMDTNSNISHLADGALAVQHNRLMNALGDVENAVRNIKVTLGKDAALLSDEDHGKLMNLVDAQTEYLQSNLITRLFPNIAKKTE